MSHKNSDVLNDETGNKTDMKKEFEKGCKEIKERVLQRQVNRLLKRNGITKEELKAFLG